MFFNNAARRAAHVPTPQLAFPLANVFHDGSPAPIGVLVDRLVAELEAELGQAIPDDQLEAVRDAVHINLVNLERDARGEQPLRTIATHSEWQIEAGRAALPDFVARARALVGRPTPPLQRMLAGVKLADVKAIVFYEAPAGAAPGWHADILFTRDIGGFGADAIGTHVDEPSATREDAEGRIVGVLAAVLACIDGENAS
ncbi:hypothetical protein [Falsiroseomonas sp. HW251]|uniref:hypothetical protein n=1 Tax=Falsiroseomonas sp. HW251 TaxID=3390998 RepID=UPI003D322DBB